MIPAVFGPDVLRMEVIKDTPTKRSPSAGWTRANIDLKQPKPPNFHSENSRTDLH